MAFEQTPLFQLNLMIFLSWPSSSTFVKPIFHLDDFSLYRIGPRIPTALEVRARATNAVPPVPIKLAAAPDLVLAHRSNRTLLPLECKCNSFGPDTDQAQQANALLSDTGPYMADLFGLPQSNSWQAFLVYAVGSDKQCAMDATLGELAKRLKSARIEAVPHSSFGIAVHDDGIYLEADPDVTSPIPSLQENPAAGIKVIELEDGEDPRPLYLVPLDPSIDAQDEYGREVLNERVRSALASLIGSRLDEQDFEVGVDEVLRTAIEVWDVWDDRESKAHLRNAVTSYMREVLRQISTYGVDLFPERDRVFFRHIRRNAALDVRRYLTSVSYRQGKLDLQSAAIQLDFGNLADGW